ncbi:FAD-dependent oxidoreductase [bacterium]|nr:FAD-dependent oxidoreductase [bacterium]
MGAGRGPQRAGSPGASRRGGALLVALLAVAGAARAGTLTVLDVQQLRLIAVDAARAPDTQRETEVLVAGGGLAGIAATLALCESGHRVLLCDETDWPGGQLTAQGMAALDDPPLVERCGGTRSYQALREGIRGRYRQGGLLLPDVAAGPRLNPGNCWVGPLACEPRVALAVIEDLLAPLVASGRLVLLRRHRVLRAGRVGARVEWVDLLDLDGGGVTRVLADYLVDATEMGDLLPACGAGFACGAESTDDTGEPSAPVTPDPDCVQAFTYAFILEHLPGESHVIPEPEDYAANRRAQPYSHSTALPDGRGGHRYALLSLFTRTPNLGGSFWTYRRLIDRSLFRPDAYPSDLSLINWPAMDYRGGTLLGDDPAVTLEHLLAARRLSLGFLYWLQTSIDHPGGRGHPELRLAAEAMGTADGLARYPYVREGRRALTLDRLREQDLSRRLNPGRTRGAFFANAVGVGDYAIDLHAGPCAAGDAPAQSSLPFQLPLGLLVSADTENLIPTGKAAGSTHITNGATRTHAVEWALGEAAGVLAAQCLEEGVAPAAVHASTAQLRALQARLVARGVPIYWYRNLSPADADFATAQLAPFASDSARVVAEGSLDWRRP